MNLHAILELSVASILVNNIVLSRFIGLRPGFDRVRTMPEALGLGISVTLIMSVASIFTWFLEATVLEPNSLGYLHTIAFILIITPLSLLLELAFEKWMPALYDSAGIHFSPLATNCAVLALALINTQANPVTGQPFTLLEALVNGCATGIGYTLTLVLMYGIRERLECSNVPAALKGLPSWFLSAGLLSLAFLGFSGLHFTRGFGG